MDVLLILSFDQQQQAKVGLAVSIEAAGEDLMEQQDRAVGSAAPPPPF